MRYDVCATMSRTTRKLIFYGLIFLFLTAGSFLIATSTGYRLSIREWSIQKTGGIFIKSSASNISLFLDNKFMKETGFFSRGALLTDLSPETHLLRIEKQGYSPWTKIVSIQPQIVTEFRDVLFVPRFINLATSTPEEIAVIQALPSLQTPQKQNPAFKIDRTHQLVNAQDKTKSAKPLASNVHSFQTFDDVILFIDRNGFLARFDRSDNTTQTLGHPGFFLNEKSARFILSPAGEVAILDSMGGLFILNASDAIETFPGNAREIAFDSQGKKMLILDEKEIEILQRADNLNQPFQKKGTRESLLKLADSHIKAAQWFYGDDAHVALLTKDGVFLTELDGRGGRNTADLYQEKIDELVTMPQIPQVIFLRKEKTWYKIEF